MKKAFLLIATIGVAACGSSGTNGSTTGGATATSGGATATNGGATATNGGTAASNGGASTGHASSGGASSGGGSATTTTGGASAGASASNGGSAGSTGAPTTWAATVLLDNDGNDGYAGNPPTDDFSLGFYVNWLTGQDTGEPALSPLLNPYLYSEPQDGSDSNDPTYKDLTTVPTTNLIWFCADNYGDQLTISNAQDTALVAWLQTGGKTLVIFAPAVFYDRGVGGWTTTEIDALLSSFAVGDVNNPDVATSGSDTDIEDVTNAVVVTGGSNSYFTGKSWTLGAGEAAAQYAGSTSYNVRFYWGGVNPVAGADVLGTIQADPLETGTNITVPVIVGVKNATVGGTATTSTIVYVGLTPENINNGLATNSMQDLFAAIQQYAGL